jgi:hypothetical protein
LAQFVRTQTQAARAQFEVAFALFVGAFDPLEQGRQAGQEGAQCGARHHAGLHRAGLLEQVCDGAFIVHAAAAPQLAHQDRVHVSAPPAA